MADELIHIVDDDRGVRGSLSVVLEAEGYAVCAHNSARSFLDAIDLNQAGCVVTDVRMPDMIADWIS